MDSSRPANRVAVKLGKRLCLIVFFPIALPCAAIRGMVELCGTYADMWKDTDSWVFW